MYEILFGKWELDEIFDAVIRILIHPWGPEATASFTSSKLKTTPKAAVSMAN
jgi:hypothetical protein